MSGLDLLEAEELVSEPVSDEPAMWRNWWRATRSITLQCVTCGATRPVRSGQVFRSHCGVYPSKSAAEAAAASHYRKSEYLGALPVGEAP